MVVRKKKKKCFSMPQLLRVQERNLFCFVQVSLLCDDKSIIVHSVVSTPTSLAHNSACLVYIVSFRCTCVPVGLRLHLLHPSCPHVYFAGTTFLDASRTCARRFGRSEVANLLHLTVTMPSLSPMHSGINANSVLLIVALKNFVLMSAVLLLASITLNPKKLCT